MKTRKVLKAAALSALLLAGSTGVGLAQDQADSDLPKDHELISGVPYDGFLKGVLVRPKRPPVDEVEPVVEEDLVYDISFLIFRNAAVGSLKIRYLPERDLYEGVVAAQTKGIIGFLSFYRRDTYRSLMRLAPDGRLIPVEFHKKVRMGGSETASTTVLDYQAGVIRWRSTKVNDYETEVEAKSHPIPAGAVYEDFISAFLNLRRGVYGPIRPGKEIRVPSLPTEKWFKEREKKTQYFTIKVGERRVDKDGVSRMVITLNVPKELFGQKVGKIQFHIGDDKVPSRITAKKVILFGDMKGKLRSRRTARKELAAVPSSPAAESKRPLESPPTIFGLRGFPKLSLKMRLIGEDDLHL